MAVGGVDKEDKDSSRICQYQPDSGAWVKAGALPTPRRKCSCVVMGDGRIMVAGGNRKRRVLLKTVDILSCTPQYTPHTCMYFICYNVS